MKSKDFAESLRQISELLDVGKPNAASEQVRKFASIFASLPNSTVAATIKRLGSAEIETSGREPNLGGLASTMRVLRESLSNVAKAGFLTDLKHAEAFLQTHSSVDLDRLTEVAPSILSATSGRSQATTPLRQDLIDEYAERLEAALADENIFCRVYDQLSEDRNVGKREAVAIAKILTQSAARSKADAMKKIMNRHRSLMTFRAKSDSRAGRSAA